MNSRVVRSADLKRIPERNVRPSDVRWIVQIDVGLTQLEKLWGAPEVTIDDFTEWFCFAFSAGEENSFTLIRQVDYAPTPGFVLSVTGDLFSLEGVEAIIEALGISGARVTHINDEIRRHPTRPE
ncbi:hypothetical protein [Streptomyces sp. NPDC002530]